MMEELKQYLLTKLGISRINERLDYLSSFINLTSPEHLELDPLILARVLKKIKEKEGITDFNHNIHKNDIMFAFSLLNHRYHAEQALYSYYAIGAQTVLRIADILKKENIVPHRILDFGSGYGRVSRFFPAVFPDAEVEVSEVKHYALEFQQRSFGFAGIFHTQDANTFPEEKFDFILALSVFTHIPQKAFEAWLDKLVQSLNPKGALIFTFFSDDQYKGSSPSKQDFTYVKQSEDTLFSFVPDSISNTADYGETYVSPEYIARLLNQLDVTYTFLTKEEFGDQKGVLVKRNAVKS